ncbi:MAG: glucose-6-phosphate isomerase [Clostridiales bacterium]|nr:glucose-6-phosphate isomerase [Clostridiales bacterium]
MSARIKLNDKYLEKFISKEAIAAMQPEVDKAIGYIRNRNGLGSHMLGWVDLPVKYDKNEFARIKVAAAKIRRSCEIFIVIGIGGSYLGARAAIEFIKSPLYNNLKKDTPDIYFSGNNISAQSMSEIQALCAGRDICVNVVSKSGTTTEPAIAFRIFREMLENKYGEAGARERIFVTTDKERGALKTLADEKGYETFVVPNDVGGRYSVLTAVGLLPIAVSGADISALMTGAAEARKEYSKTDDVTNNDCFKYAAIRNMLHRGGKAIELMVGYEPALAVTAEWWKQLYGESEGKDGKALFPAAVVFTTDLHSLGQIIQQGTHNLFETVIKLAPVAFEDDISIPMVDDEQNLDDLNYIANQGLTMDAVNAIAYEATAVAHNQGGVPNVVLELAGKTEADFGYLVYFFELACAVSGYILGVNPFDQPGVEAYKQNMFALLGKADKPGETKLEDIRKALRKGK